MIIGLTGGIGAGKSVVARILRCYGFDVYDCDYEARLIMDGSDEIKHLIVQNIGSECVFSTGELNRKAIAECVFSDHEKRNWLNSIVHSVVRKDIIEKNSENTERKWFVESAILASSGLASLCRFVWVVDAPLSVRITRACIRDKVESENIMARIKAQEKELEMLQGNTNISKIINYGRNSLISQIRELLTKI